MTTRAYFAARIKAAKEDDEPAQIDCVWCIWLKLGLDTQIPNLGAEQCPEHKKLNIEYGKAIRTSPIESDWKERQRIFIERAKEIYEAKQRRAA
jgi:hypothetical protein